MKLDIEEEEVIDFDPFLNENLDKLRRLRVTYKMIENKDEFNPLFIDDDITEEQAEKLRKRLLLNLARAGAILSGHVLPGFHSLRHV